MIPAVKIRSRFQIETRTDYALRPELRATHTGVEAYLFVPRVLGINAETYPRYLFYRDIQTISELGLSPVPLDQLVDPGSGPVAQLRSVANAYADQPDEQSRVDLETQLRIFGRVFGDSLRAGMGRLREQQDVSLRLQSARQFLRCVALVREQLDAVRNTVETAAPDGGRDGASLLCDEYFSLMIEQTCLRVIEQLHGSDAPEAVELGAELLATARAEAGRRGAPTYQSSAEAEEAVEHSVYRLRALRTFVDSVLALATRHQPEGRVAQELLLSMAAGLAMVFATAVAFLAHVRYENWTSAFFVTLVISYMFKDRIKAQVQTYFRSKQRRFFYDYRTKVYGEATQDVIGIQRESFGFIDGARVDPKVLEVRNRDPLSSLDNDYCGESVMLYKQRTSIYSLRFSEIFRGYPVRGVNEVVRFDLTRFARKMENPEGRVFMPVGSGYKRMRAQHVYHLNLVVKHTAHEATAYFRFRIVMGVDGIRRIESVST